MRSTKLKIIALVSASIIVTSVLLIQSRNPLWRDHLRVDFGFYYWVAQGFKSTGTFGTMTNNSYFPGSLFFFLVPTLYANTWDSYVNAFIITNVVLILGHLLIYLKFSWKAAFISLGIFLFSGPLILFRHELLPSIVVLLSILYWKKNRFWLSALLLGFGVGIKLYPVFILPYYLILTLANRRYRDLFFVPSFFMLGMLSLVIPYIMLGSPPSELVQSLSFNTEKPVHIESLWASGLTLQQKIANGMWIKGRADLNGIYGIDPIFNPIPLNLLNVVWMFPLLIYYVFLLYRSYKTTTFSTKALFIPILIFIVFSKVITPQYLYWFFLLFPILDWGKMNKLKTIFICALSFIILVLTQYIYPLHYNDLLWGFYTNGSSPFVFYILLLRNFLLVALLLASLVLI